MRQVSPRLTRRLGVTVGLALLLPGLVGPPAAADELGEKRAEAARLERQLEEDARRVSQAAERYNRAQLELHAVRSSLEKAKGDLARADERMRAVRGLLAQAAIQAYVSGGSGTFFSRLARSDNDNLVLRQQYLRFTAADQRSALGELKLAREDFTAVQARLAGEEEEAAAAASSANDARRAALDAERDQRNSLGRVKGEIGQLVAAETARREADEAARAPVRASPAAPAAPVAQKGGPKAAPAPEKAAGPAPPVASGAAAAVAEAKRQIGKPYKWGGEGPDSFDCSGLTMWAWRAGGVRLSHSALAQYRETTRVPLSAIQPGDLLFFGPSVSGIHHNAIYVGDNQMVEASQTGTPVRYRAMGRSDLVGVGRPG
ncbi:MAG TPA: NlpC/P60 family protein [Acidimicrobiales bacterium]|nr:NlpC/P60 family protein [Acidimicrobiales bacterium]